MQDATKVLLGSTGSSAKEASDLSADPATFPAGTAVRLKSDGTISVTKAHGLLLGVSLGKSLSDHKKLSVVRTGESVPIKITDLSAFAQVQIGDILFKAVTVGEAGNDLSVILSDDVTDGSAEVTDVTAGVITISIQDGVTTADDIAAAVLASPEASALIVAIVDDGEGSTAEDAATSTPLTDGRDLGDFCTIGTKVYIDDVTGLANDSDETVTVSDAIYVSGPLTGVNEDSSTTPCALVDMPGGL